MESSGAQLTNGSFATCADVTFGTAQVAGYPLAIFELDIAGFSTAPTAGAFVSLYERKLNSDGNAAPVPDATYKYDPIGTFPVDVADEAQYLSLVAPINYFGGTYYLEWKDGGAGSASIDSTWVLRVTPFTYYPAT